MMILYILIAIIVILVVLAILSPKNYDVNRSILINKQLPEVFTYLKSLKNQDLWSSWGTKDPNMIRNFTGKDGTVGCIASWKGNKEVGEGEQEITKIVENELIESELRFLKPFKSTSNAYFKVTEEEKETKVIWGFFGENKFPMRFFMLFMNMDKMVGNDFEIGLKKLKELLEK